MTGAAAASVKSPEAFRTISEVAEMLDVPQHVLRFWESRFAHIKPIKRAGGRRFYRPEDIDLLRGIRTLLYHEGYTIKGVQKILREKGVRYAAEVGRTEPQKSGRARKQDGREPVSSDESENGFDALATLARVHEDAAEAIAFDGERRARLESLLKDLLALKVRLRDTRAKVFV
ncbi:MAG TPA: MerR family transcriptional regulator [Rhizomicrobium sp.]|jgi:DNA-binding transcriptional MerR regulator|nr:MerR family transcriptional regulator [Rhizomicrobium sp.]